MKEVSSNGLAYRKGCYPFGMEMPNRSFSGSDKYSYGFQGQLLDDEIKGENNSVNYKYRMHDPRTGRFFAVDPLEIKYPHNSPYAFSENMVIHKVELEGLEAGELPSLRKSEENYLGMDRRRMYNMYYIRDNAKMAFNATHRIASKGMLNGKGGLRDDQADAFRHAFWNALNMTKTSWSFGSFGFARVHELGEDNPALNPESPHYDPVGVQMDLHNNAIGQEIAENNPDSSPTELKNKVLNEVKKGNLVIIKMDDMGNYLDKSGNILEKDEFGELKNPEKKVLIRSNGEEFKGKLKGQFDYKPDLTIKKKVKKNEQSETY